MDHQIIRDTLSWVQELTPEQLSLVTAALTGQVPNAASQDAIEFSADTDYRAPHCDTVSAVFWGKARDLRRYTCRDCGRTFGALTGTPLLGLHHKERWLSLSQTPAEGNLVRASVKRYGMGTTMAFRWRHRFLEDVRQEPDWLTGIVEADEAFFLESRKGLRDLDREAAPPGRKVVKRGFSHEKVKVLMAADCTGAILVRTTMAVTADALRQVLQPVIAGDALLVSNASSCYSPVARAFGIRHESLNRNDGERVRGVLHIQTVNSRYRHLKGFLRFFRVVFSKYTDRSYLRWFQLVALGKTSSPRTCLDAAMAKPCIRFIN